MERNRLGCNINVDSNDDHRFTYWLAPTPLSDMTVCCRLMYVAMVKGMLTSRNFEMIHCCVVFPFRNAGTRLKRAPLGLEAVRSAQYWSEVRLLIKRAVGSLSPRNAPSRAGSSHCRCIQLGGNSHAIVLFICLSFVYRVGRTCGGCVDRIFLLKNKLSWI